MLPYPKFDPILATVGPVSIRWYGLAYLAGALLGTHWVSKTLKGIGFTQDDIVNWMTWIMMGVILGGRVGYIVFYGLAYYLQNLGDMVAVWKGGMSYHGGALGALIGTILFARQHKKPAWVLLDQLGLGSTFGIFFGRLANFINGELVGKITNVPWAMIFPHQDLFPRHPSQLYEAFFEGLVLFLILNTLKKRKSLRPGDLFGHYLIGYGTCRVILEFFRQPDPQLGLILDNLMTMGQLLSIVMIGCGVAILIHKRVQLE